LTSKQCIQQIDCIDVVAGVHFRGGYLVEDNTFQKRYAFDSAKHQLIHGLGNIYLFPTCILIIIVLSSTSSLFSSKFSSGRPGSRGHAELGRFSKLSAWSRHSTTSVPSRATFTRLCLSPVGCCTAQGNSSNFAKSRKHCPD
jgi:hypothetical protein